MFNDALLEYEMKIRKISRTGKSEWTYSEMQKIGDTLGKDAAVRIFSA